ncbi:MAG: hypothetical protein IT457_21740 [Planctomycetes bacterium]|nr:hypothetical protein [Planctomycetota bacterium]
MSDTLAPLVELAIDAGLPILDPARDGWRVLAAMGTRCVVSIQDERVVDPRDLVLGYRPGVELMFWPKVERQDLAFTLAEARALAGVPRYEGPMALPLPRASELLAEMRDPLDRALARFDGRPLEELFDAILAIRFDRA